MKKVNRVIHLGVYIMTIGLCLSACAVLRNKSRTEVTLPQSGDESSDQHGKQQVDLRGFTRLPDEQFIDQAETPFTVHKVQGTILHGHFDEAVPLEGVLIEVRGMGTDEKIWKTLTDERGNFKIDNLPFGEYVFKTSYHGFRPVFGSITLLESADRKSTIAIRLKVDK